MRIARLMKDPKYRNAIAFNNEEDGVREPPRHRSPNIAIDDAIHQWPLLDERESRAYFDSKSLREILTVFRVPGAGGAQILLRRSTYSEAIRHLLRKSSSRTSAHDDPSSGSPS